MHASEPRAEAEGPAAVSRLPSGVARALRRDGRFTVAEALGAGAAGAVFRARDNARRQDIALKLLSSVEPHTLYRFKQEFRSLSDIVHPNLVTLYGLHHIDEHWVLAMELVADARPVLDYVRPYSHLLASSLSSNASSPGPEAAEPAEGDATHTRTASTLKEGGDRDTTAQEDTSPTSVSLPPPVRPGKRKRQAIAAASLVPERLERALAQLVDGVGALHNAGILHRDLKPSNVLVDRVGRLVICDFGLATQAHRGQGAFAGTPAYSSPEQAALAELGPASDWYSIGVMLYEALTGALPILGDSVADTLRRKKSATVRHPLEIAPDADRDLAELAMELLHVEPRARPRIDEIRERLGSVAVRGTEVAGADAGPFVGRAREQATLQQAFDDALEVGAVTALVSGESGVGKSALVRHVTRGWVETDNALVLAGRCYENELVAFKTVDSVVDALADALLELSEQDARALLDESIVALATVFPVLRRVAAVSKLMAALPRPSDDVRLRADAARGLRHLLVGLAARRPTVVVIDDLQWGDMDSAAFLLELSSYSGRSGFLLLGTYRGTRGGMPPLVAALLDESNPAVRLGHVRSIAVPPLPRDEAEQLFRSIAGATERAPAALADAGGSPLFVAELAHARATGAEHRTGADLDGLIAERVEALDPSARALLDVIAVSGRPRASVVLAGAAGTRDEAADLAVLRRGRFIRVEHGRDGELLAPYHDRIRATTLGLLDGDRRRRLHHRLARALERTADRDVEGLVEHWLGAGERRKAGDYALVAAERAKRAQAYRRAAQHYATAIELADPGPARLELEIARADALEFAGTVREAAAAFRDVAERSAGEVASELIGRALVCLLRAGEIVEADALARNLYERVGLRLPTTRSQALLQIALSRARIALHQAAARPSRPRALPETSNLRLDVARDVSTALGFSDPLAGYAVHCDYLRAALETGEPRRLIQLFCNEAAFVAGLKGRRARRRADALFARADELARDEPAEYAQAIGGARAFADFLYYENSRDVGSRLLEAARGMESDASLTWQADLFRHYSTRALVLGGELAEVRHQLPGMVRQAQDNGNDYLAANYVRQTTSFVWLAADQPAEAARLLDRLRPTDDGPPGIELYYATANTAEVEAYAGDPVAAHDRMRAFFQRVRGSSLARVPGLMLFSEQIAGRVAVAASYVDQKRRGALLAEARRCAKRLRRQRRELADFALAQAAFIEGLCAHAEGRRELAIRNLRLATDGLALSAPVWAWPIRVVLGRLIGGTEGEFLAHTAQAWFRDQQIGNPDRFVEWVCPTGATARAR